MPAKLYRVKLNQQERQYCEKLIKAGTAKARKITRARILLLADESQGGKSKTDSHIAESLRCCLRTIAVMRERFFREGLEAALNERPRPGKPPILFGKDEALLTTLACSEPPPGQARWTLRLLADKVVELDIVESVSHETIRDRLKKTNLSPGNADSGVSEK